MKCYSGVSDARRGGWRQLLLSAAVLFALCIGLPLSPTGAMASDSALYEAAKKEGKLTIYTDQTVQLIQDVIAGFTKRYPGIDADFFRGDSSQVIQRFETESAAGRHVADVLTSTERRSRLLKDKGLLSPYRSVHFDSYPKGLHPADHMWSVYSVTLTAFAWNTNKVAGAEVPQDWNDLLDQKWRGRIGIQDPLQGGGVASWIATMYAVWGEERWANYMQQLAAQKPKYGRYLQVQDMLAAGDVVVMVAAYPDYLQSSLKDKGAPVEWGTPNPVVRTGLSVNLSANAPHSAAGKLFVDYMLSDEVQGMLAKVGKLPALEAQWPTVFDRLKSTQFVPPADELEQKRFDFFQKKMNEFFGKR